MKKILFILILLASNFALSQDICDNGIDDDNDGLIDLNDTTDCACISSQISPNLILNPSFEDDSCCPTSHGQIHCASNWQRGSLTSSDYFNTCNYYPSSIPSAPDGNALTGFHCMTNYKEYVGTCLDQSIVANVSYTLNFQLGFEYIQGNFDSRGCNAIMPPPLDITIFGAPNCNDIPFNSFNCPIGIVNWIELGHFTYSPTLSFINASITFVSSIDINAIAIGPPCLLATPAYVNDGSGCWKYFMLDNLILKPTQNIGIPTSFIVDISQKGSFCTNDIVLTANSDTTGNWQWFKEGIALIGETDSILNVSNNNFATGKYSVRLVNGIKCKISDYILDTNYITTPAIFDDSICANLDSGKLEALNIMGENIGRPIQYFINGGGPFTDSVFTNLTPNTYQIVISDTNLCRDTVIGEVVALALPVTDFYADTICIGSPTTFVNNSLGTNANVIWSFGDGTFGNQNIANLQHLYNNAGVYMVKLVTQTNRGCLDSSSIQVLVYDKPIADFTFINDCEGSSIQFNNTTTIGGGTNTNGLSWNWNFDNTNTSTQKDPTEVYLTSGIYDVTLLVSSPSACNADTIKQLEIYANPVADFDVVPVCFGEITQINDLSNVSSGAIIAWNYEVENINYTVQNPMHQSSVVGSHDVKLKIFTGDGCVDSITRPAVINPLPIANFDFSPSSLNIFKTEACFNNFSTGTTVYFWDYGFLNKTSIVNEECIKYPTDIVGFYDVFLRATNQFGCSDSITKTIEIQEVFLIYVPNTFTPDGDGENDIFMPVITGASGIYFYIFDRWGKEFFYTSTLGKGWDGTYKNKKLVQQDTYVYRIIATDINGKKHLKEGHVNLVK
jgi:gliding motility-associated-like protein